MKKLNRNRSLKEHLAMTWIVSAGLALITCAFAFAAMGWIDYQNQNARLTDDLISKSTTASRRLSGELLLGAKGASTSVSASLQSELELARIEITSSPLCPDSSKDKEFCVKSNLGSISVQRIIPYLQSPTYLTISKTSPPFFTIARFSNFFLSILPIGLVLAFALGLQRYSINRYVLKPISALIDTSTGDQSPKDHWPRELNEIASQLAKTFENREKSIYEQMARGVIHDIRTLLHSMLSATELVKEQEVDPIKRQLRLETLFKACASNLPKINELITLTLDGSREISIRPKSSDLTETIKSAIRTNESLSLAKKVAIKLDQFPESILVLHDPVQLERVFTNLIKNGIEACLDRPNQSGTVLISATSDQQKKEISIVVEDSGVGLPDIPAKMFRLLKSTKVHGSGLGLLVSRKIVEAHGGMLLPNASLKLGGALFEVRLPLKETEALT